MNHTEKVLFVATVVKNHIMEFHIPYLKMFKEAGWETSVAAKNDYEKLQDCDIPYCDNYYDIPFARSPLKIENVRAYRTLRNEIENGYYDIIHCHTPVGAFLTRLAARRCRKKGTRVIYTAHGFHFYKGAPIINWILYYPVEKFCARFTDILITINQEDYAFAKRKLHAKRVEYVPGVGIDTFLFQNVLVDRNSKRKELGVSETDFLIVCVGELIKRKNHETVIRAISKLPDNVQLVIAGRGVLAGHLESLVHELHLERRVHLLGYRRDIPELYKVADVCVLPSFQEGLPVALMEGMSAGLPCIASRIRGCTDLLDEFGGFLCDPLDISGYADSIMKLIENESQRLKMGQYNCKKIKNYDREIVDERMRKIYSI